MTGELVLLDEELAVLAPGAGPLPHLDTLTDVAAVEVARDTAARGLLLRGLAVLDETGTVLPADDLVDLLAPLRGGGPVVQVVVVGVEDLVLAAVRPHPDGGAVLQDVSPDGVHVLSRVDAQVAVDALRELADPSGRAAAVGVGWGPFALAVAPDRAVTLTRVERGAVTVQVSLAERADGLWQVEARAAGVVGRALSAAERDDLLSALSGLEVGRRERAVAG